MKVDEMDNRKGMIITTVICCLMVGIPLTLAIIKGIKESNLADASKTYTAIIGDRTYSGCTNVMVFAGNGTIYFDCDGKTYHAYGYTITEER
jgi:hypothetical protein